MSAETKAALDEAIAAHVADETDGGMVTGYVLLVANSTVQDFDDHRTCYLAEYAENQPYHVGLGLVHRHRLIVEDELYAEDDD